MVIRALAASLLAAGPALAEITVLDAYARSAGPLARTGAAYMVLRNDGAADDRLIGVTTEAAARAALHAHRETGDGVMRMIDVEDGLLIPAGGSHALDRGGDHVMLMGLSAPWRDGDTVTLVLEFEQAGEITVDIPVDQTRQPGEDGGS